MSLTNAAAEMARASNATRTPDEQAAHMRKMRRALAVREIVDQAPDFTPEQVAKIRAVLSGRDQLAREVEVWPQAKGDTS
jgi:hypothetical protein